MFPTGNHANRNDKKRIETIRKHLAPRDNLIVKKRLEAKSQRAIAAEVTAETGKRTTQHTVCNVLRREDISAMLEHEYCRLAAAVPKVTENIINAAHDFDTSQGADDKRISWEANKLIAQAHGIIPTAQQSIVHQTYINNQVNTIIPPVIAELAAKHFGGMVNIKNRLDQLEAIEVENAQLP